MQIHLVGLNHAHQLSGYKHGAADAFDAFLSTLCCSTNIDLIAEELNEEAISLWRADGSVARNVATRLSITHIFCDPVTDDRKRLGILTAKEIAAKQSFGKFWNSSQDAVIIAAERMMWPIRERFWLECLRSVTFCECVFILGSKHVDSFEMLLHSEGFMVHVSVPDWKP